MIHTALTTTKAILEWTSLDGFYYSGSRGRSPLQYCEESVFVSLLLLGLLWLREKHKGIQGKEQINKETDKMAQMGKKKNKTRENICEAGQNL